MGQGEDLYGQTENNMIKYNKIFKKDLSAMSNIKEITDYNAKELDIYVRLTGAQLRH